MAVKALYTLPTWTRTVALVRDHAARRDVRPHFRGELADVGAELAEVLDGRGRELVALVLVDVDVDQAPANGAGGRRGRATA